MVKISGILNVLELAITVNYFGYTYVKYKVRKIILNFVYVLPLSLLKYWFHMVAQLEV